MLEKRSLELHTPQWGYVVRVPEGNSTTLNYTGYVYSEYTNPEFLLYMGNPGNFSLVPDSRIRLSSISSADDPRLSTYSIPAEDLDAMTPQSACNYKFRVEDEEVKTDLNLLEPLR
ncbi:hypothetical protein LTR70_010224 [Exophiala xenobiotica]|uniref:Uncharacterized protein n=1 Tax=Lithohypha guttulata TaxID=1690604 RepID=A0ABR0JUS5_9EURO|nr:hypothetical protein LTR24_010174 [Lithohypha guttulata]KAK5309510.1 hypothetical protein LTR70_010224 [Exophiala xenobiotica]